MSIKKTVKKSKTTSTKKKISKNLKSPLIVVNFKTYEEATGHNALKLALICDEVAKETNANIIVCPQVADLQNIVRHVSIPVYAQHVDSIEYGSNTGRILPQSLKSIGVSGTLLNHSERRLRIDIIEKSIELCKKNELKTIVCANDAIIGQAVYAMHPDYVAVEPPELIGGNVSVSTAKPKIITDSVNKVCKLGGKNKVLVGAGVKNNKDVKKSLKLGAWGVLLASGITKSKNPRRTLRELVKNI